MYGKSKNSTVPSDSQAREKYVLIFPQKYTYIDIRLWIFCDENNRISPIN